MLIVEDEVLLALSIEDMLIELGYSVAGTATRIDKALSLAAESEFDLAVLDINLAGAHTFPVAGILRSRGIPFIFMSGYGTDGLPDAFVGSHLLTKPFSLKELEQKLIKALSESLV